MEKRKWGWGKENVINVKEEVTWLHLFINSTNILNYSVSVTLSSEPLGGVGEVTKKEIENAFKTWFLIPEGYNLLGDNNKLRKTVSNYSPHCKGLCFKKN